MEKAIVARVYVKKHPNADRLLVGDVKGFTVVVSKDTENGQLGVFFPSDLSLSNEFCVSNNLYPIYDSLGKRIGGGFFDQKTRRVKAQNFRGVKSEGFWVPLSYFDYFDVSDKYPASEFLKDQREGYQFSDIKGIMICEKWLNLETLKAIRANQKGGIKQIRETLYLPMHPDTAQLKYEIDQIPVGAKIIFTEKIHATSGRSAWSLETVRKPYIPWLTKILNKLPWIKDVFYREIKEWKFINGTRRVLVESFKEPRTNSYYQNEEFRYEVEQTLKQVLPKGFSVYYEVCHVNSQGKALMPSVNTNELGDKEFTKKYSETMTYTYGCGLNETKFFIYNIVFTTEDGFKVNLSWEQITAFCKKYGLNTVPKLLKYDYYEGDKEALKDISDYLSHGESTLDPSHIREGVCLMIEYEGDVKFLKNKSSEFYILEGITKVSGTVDIEEKESYTDAYCGAEVYV